MTFGSRLEIDQYKVFVDHGPHCPAVPEEDERVALSQIASCSETAANCSAQLLDSDGLIVEA